MADIPVLIVGGGAAGSVLGLVLARNGVAARVVDRLAGPAPSSRAITVHARTLEMMEQVDRRLVDRFLSRGIACPGYVLHFADEAGQRREVRPGMDFQSLDCRYPFMLLHRQDESEAAVRDFMAADYDRHIEWNTRCTAVEQQADGVLATLEHGDGRTEKVACHYLVAADGANSKLRTMAGMGQVGDTVQGMVLQNMDAWLENFPDDDEWVHYCAGKDHFIMIARLPGGFYRLLLSDRGEAAAPGLAPKSAFQAVIDRHFDGARIDGVVWHSVWEHGLKLADHYRQGRLFLAGDSAHVHPTTGGQGMNCCMQDAFNLGWKLAMVEKGLLKPEILDSYEAERRPVAEQVLWAASSLQDVFMGHGRDIEARRTAAQDPEWLEAIIGRCSGISYTYRGDGDAASPGLVAGDRAPDADLGDGSRLFDRMRHTGFTLLAFDPSLEPDLAAFRRSFGQLLSAHCITSTPETERHYGKGRAAGLTLVRPDGYVACRAAPGRVDVMTSYLLGISRL
jgi:NADPH-dependent dioxygenase